MNLQNLRTVGVPITFGTGYINSAVKLSPCLASWALRRGGVWGGWMCGSAFSWPRRWLGVGGRFRAPAAMPPGGRSRCPLCGRLGGTQSRSGRHGEVKILDLTV
jgi:hypothetical protein